MRRRALAAIVILAAAAPGFGWPVAAVRPAAAQAESREGIYLQNQILQLRQDLEGLRRSGGGPSGLAAPVPRGGGGQAPSNELLNQLLERVSGLEDEVRRMRGRVDESEFRTRQLGQTVEKLQGDVDFRFGQLENTSRGNRPRGGGDSAAVAEPPPTPAPAPRPAPARPAAEAAPRTPERALSEGQAALNRRDYGAAEAAAREVLAARNSPRAADAQLLLADALAGKKDNAAAALAYNDAYTRGRSGPRAPDALLGLANAFTNLGHKREACDTLDDLRGNFPNLRAPQSDRAADARRRAGCR